MSFGIADLSIIPMRREQSERSEMVSQILFGELYEVLEIGEKWVYVRLLHDGYEGWIDRKMLLPVTEEYAVRYQMERQQLATGTFHIVQKKGDWGNQLIVPGSVFPFWDAETKTMQVGDRHYLLVSKQRELAGGNVRDLLISAAFVRDRLFRAGANGISPCRHRYAPGCFPAGSFGGVAFLFGGSVAGRPGFFW